VSQEQHPDPIIRWKHRRLMAYMAMIGGLLYPLLLIVTESDNLVGLAWPFFIFVGSTVGSYIGSSVWETVKIAATTNRSK
jgi:hypothetical protein